jgi:hypothetical protein
MKKYRKPGFEPKPSPVARALKHRVVSGAGWHGQSPKAKRQQGKIELRKECF